MEKIRTRFAVSPTGYMHVGGVRNALFDWLVAKQNNGQFILRIEDTDQSREVPGATEHIKKTLDWLNIEVDETYVQSERLAIYREWAQKLADGGRAYSDPYSEEEVESFREQAKLQKKPFLFREHRPDSPPKWDGTKTLRFKSDPKVHTWNDEVMGELSAGPEAVDDFVLIKADGFPTYNFCHIIDDYLMGITHIIRSQEFISSMPRFLNLYEALEFKLPVFAHLPWIMGPDGKRKLSKRDGAKDVLDYAKDGFLPEALLNFLASLGWNDGSEQEIFSVQELIDKFSLSSIQRSGANFDEHRLIWMNGAHIRQLTVEQLYEKSSSYLPEASKDYDEVYKKQVLGLIQERLKYLSEISELTDFFFVDKPIDDDLITAHKQLSKMPREELKELLITVSASLQESDFTTKDLSKRLNDLLISTDQKPVVLFSLVRIATTQSPSSPGLFETLNVLGKDRSMSRLKSQIEAL